MPAYHPDPPELRQDWAHEYDIVSDAVAGRLLEPLATDARVEDTIVFYFPDHGSEMPRNKRSVCNSGLHLPLVLPIPEKFCTLRRATIGRRMRPIG